LPVGTAQLRLQRGDIRCRHCGTFFNALDELLDDKDADRLILDDAAPYNNRPRTYRLIPDDDAEQDDAQDHAPVVDSVEPRQREPGFAGRLIWAGASLALLLLLAAQAGYFEKDRVLKDQSLRPWLEVAASIMHQELPPYADTHFIKVNSRSLHPVHSGEGSYDFSLSLTNTAHIPQAFPSIKLVLTELNGNPIASRTFAPQDYLGNNRFAADMMPNGKSQEIHLILAKPSWEIGGFAFELL